MKTLWGKKFGKNATVLSLGLHDIPKNFEKAKKVLGVLNENFGYCFEGHLSKEVSHLFSLLNSQEREIFKKRIPSLRKILGFGDRRAPVLP